MAFRCLNFYGIETESTKPVCSWKHAPSWYMQRAKEKLGIDRIRVPFSYSYGSCGDWQALDDLVQQAKAESLQVILDYHRGYEDHQGESPVEGLISKDDWIDMLITVAQRYEKHPHVIALDLFNEPQLFNKTLYEGLYREAITALESVLPQRYEYWVGCADWGKDCSGMWSSLPTNRTVVSVHTYSFAGKDWATRFPANGVVGEVGWRTNDTQWISEFTSFVRRKRMQGLCLWTVAHSHDTDNFFQDDCETMNDAVIQAFQGMFFSPQCLRGKLVS
jgi:hypothetical protein